MKKHKLSFDQSLSAMTCALSTASDEIRLLIECMNHHEKKLKIWAFKNLSHLMN